MTQKKYDWNQLSEAKQEKVWRLLRSDPSPAKHNLLKAAEAPQPRPVFDIMLDIAGQAEVPPELLQEYREARAREAKEDE